MKRVIVCILCGVIAFLLAYTNIIGSVDKTAEDVLYHKAGAMEGKIKIIKIDDKSRIKWASFQPGTEMCGRNWLRSYVFQMRLDQK